MTSQNKARNGNPLSIDGIEGKDGWNPNKHEAQKTKADWLKSEIEKLEGMKNENQSYIDSLTPREMSYENPRFIESRGVIKALTSIITRYKEELLELEKGV